MHLRHDIGTFARQTTAITTQVIQSIRLLQLGAGELDEFLREQAERNPLIEVSGSSSGEAGRTRPLPSEGGIRSSAASGAAADNGIERYLAGAVSLRDFLLQQAAMAFRAPADIAIATDIIDSLDEAGYLTRKTKMIARRLACTPERVDEVLAVIHGFEPAGIGARSLSECLALQLRERNRYDPAMACLLENLPLLAKYDLKKLARLCGVDMEDITAMAAEIRELDPRPGRRFDTAPVPPALPDVLVRRGGDGSWRVELNSELLPRVLVNRQYYSEITAGKLGAEDKRFVVDCMRDATWLARNVDQRAQTILTVSTEIVAQQQAFLDHGVEHLRPLNLADVAGKVGVHVSTVCRAISGKYLMTDRGLFELKFFFSNSVGATEGEEESSSETVRHRIQSMVAAETAATVLSDEAIVQELRKGGIDIARRTVAKYRDILSIPSSLQRRRMKKAEAYA